MTAGVGPGPGRGLEPGRGCGFFVGMIKPRPADGKGPDQRQQGLIPPFGGAFNCVLRPG